MTWQGLLPEFRPSGTVHADRAGDVQELTSSVVPSPLGRGDVNPEKVVSAHVATRTPRRLRSELRRMPRFSQASAPAAHGPSLREQEERRKRRQGNKEGIIEAGGTSRRGARETAEIAAAEGPIARGTRSKQRQKRRGLGNEMVRICRAGLRRDRLHQCVGCGQDKPAASGNSRGE